MNEFNKHTSRKFNEELESVRNSVLKMGGLVEEMLTQALHGFFQGDSQVCTNVIAMDDQVNDLELEIDDECRRILATRAPAAIDLRLIMAIIKTITDIERMGDEAEKIARLSINLLESTEIIKADHLEIQTMGELVQTMTKKSLDAFARFDSELALATFRSDEMVDSQYESLSRSSITHMMEDPRSITKRLNIMWIARALERIGDHSKNICEYVIYTEKGQDIRHAEEQVG
jgi:phosphate transport system protein